MALSNWDDLRVFFRVAKARSFSAAAINGPMNQSTISRRIINLEQELGVSLFHRTARGIILTDAGRSLVDLVFNLEKNILSVEAKASEAMGLSGTIRVSVAEVAAVYFLLPRITKFNVSYPNIKIEMNCFQERADCNSRDADIWISWRRPVDPDAVILAETAVKLGAFASSDYVARHGNPASFSELKSHRICQHAAYPSDGEWHPWAESINQYSNVSFFTNSSWALGQATVNGVGISLQPIGADSRQPALQAISLEGYEPKLSFWLFCHMKVKDIPRVRAFIEYLKLEMKRAAEDGPILESNDGAAVGLAL